MIIVFNPVAGLRRAQLLWRVLDVLVANGIRVELAETHSPGHAAALARRLLYFRTLRDSVCPGRGRTSARRFLSSRAARGRMSVWNSGPRAGTISRQAGAGRTRRALGRSRGTHGMRGDDFKRSGG